MDQKTHLFQFHFKSLPTPIKHVNQSTQICMKVFVVPAFHIWFGAYLFLNYLNSQMGKNYTIWYAHSTLKHKTSTDTLTAPDTS